MLLDSLLWVSSLTLSRLSFAQQFRAVAQSAVSAPLRDLHAWAITPYPSLQALLLPNWVEVWVGHCFLGCHSLLHNHNSHCQKLRAIL